MKYLKSYEGVKNKANINIELKNKLNQLIPGMYIIYTRNKLINWKDSNVVNILSLSKIQETRVEHYYNSYGEDDGLSCSVYLNVLDFITSGDASSIPLGDGWLKVDDVLNNKLYMTASLNDAESKFAELKKEYLEKWEIEINTNKFNL